jgi:hypothetical protein
MLARRAQGPITHLACSRTAVKTCQCFQRDRAKAARGRESTKTAAPGVGICRLSVSNVAAWTGQSSHLALRDAFLSRSERSTLTAGGGGEEAAFHTTKCPLQIGGPPRSCMTGPRLLTHYRKSEKQKELHGVAQGNRQKARRCSLCREHPALERTIFWLQHFLTRSALARSPSRAEAYLQHVGRPLHAKGGTFGTALGQRRWEHHGT